MKPMNEVPEQALPCDDEHAGSGSPSPLDHLFRHVLKDEQVNPLYFLLQRYRSQAGEAA